MRIDSPNLFGFSYLDTGSGNIIMNSAIGSYTLTNVERVETYDGNGVLNYLLLVGGAGNDVLDGSADSPGFQLTIHGLDGNDTLTGGNSFTDLYGGDGNDILTSGSGGGLLDGGAGADTLNGGSGFDTLIYQLSSAAVNIDLTGNTANTGGDAAGDVFSGSFESVYGSNFGDTIIGSNNTSFQESIFAGDGNDTVSGGDGDDQIYGDGGSDLLTGGNGNDTFIYYGYENGNSDELNDTITDFAIGDRLQMQEGIINGTFQLPTFIGTSAFSGTVGEMRYEKTGGQTLIHLDTNGDGTANQTLTLSNGEFDLLEVNSDVFSFNLIIDTSVNGTPGPDTLNGTPGDDIINGLGGNDIITTLTGNDMIDGGDGDDTIIGDVGGSGTIEGGTGTDLFQVTFNSSGFGTFYSQGTETLEVFTSGGFYQLTNVERYEALDTGGTATQVTLVGDSTSETLDGSAETTGSLVVYGAGGNDTITGTGASGFDQLYGGVGNDIIYGMGGADILYGEDGDDQLFGGDDNDALYDNRGINVLDGGAGFDDANLTNLSFNPGQGLSQTATAGDTLADATSSSTWQFTAVENIRLEGTFDNDVIDFSGFNQADVNTIFVTSSQGQDSVTVNGTTNTDFVYDIEGYSAGFMDGDTISGFSLNDTLLLRNFDTLDSVDLNFIGTAAFTNSGGEVRYIKNATDTVVELDRDGDGVADETLTLTEAMDLQVNQSGSFGAGAGYLRIGQTPPPIDGTAGPDTLMGTPGDDVINGFAGDDVITTFTGTDTVDAGDDDDLIIVDPATMGTVEGGSGYDTVQVTVDAALNYFLSFLLSPDNLTVYSVGPGLTFTGVERIEEIDLGSGLLESLFLLGSTGADTINVTGESFTSNGRLFISTSDGDDVVTMDANITAPTTVYQGEGNDIFTAGSGYAIVYGSAGADTITGSANLNGSGPSDTVDYRLSTAGVTVDLDAGTGLGGDAQGDVLSGIETIYGSTAGSNTLTGDAATNLLFGGDLADTIDGGDGDDFLVGGQGVDTLTGGAGGDVFYTFGDYTGGFTGTITDFEAGDVVAGAVGYADSNGFFTISWLGQGAFTGLAGELRYEKTGGQTLIHIDTNGDATANETLTLANGEFDLFDFNNQVNNPGSFAVGIAQIITPNLVTTTADEIAEDTDLQTQGNDGTGLSLREAIEIANVNNSFTADVITYDTNVAGQIINTSPNGTISIWNDLELSPNVTLLHEVSNPIFDIGATTNVTNGADIFFDTSNTDTFAATRTGIIISGNLSTFTNSGTINANGFGTVFEDRSNAIGVLEANVTINNEANAFIISQGRMAINSFAFDPNTSAYIPDYLTVNNDGTIESQDDAIRIGTGTINNTGTIRTTGEFGAFYSQAGAAADAIAVVNGLDASFTPGPDGILVVNNSSTGLIEGARSAIQMQGGGTVNNDGTISGEVVALLSGGYNDFSNIFVLNNAGTVTAGAENYGLNADQFGAVSLFSGLDSAVITNSGTIQSGSFGIFSTEAVDLTNTTTGQIIGDTDGSGDDDVSFYGTQLTDLTIEASVGFPGSIPNAVYENTQGITVDGNGDFVIPAVGTFPTQFGQIEVAYAGGDNPILPLVDIAATQNSGFLTFQTDVNGTIYPATIDINSPYGVLTIDWVSGSGFTVTDANGNPAYALDPATDYADSIDNNGLMSGDIITGLGNDAIINRGNIADNIYLGAGNDNYTAGAAGLSGDIYGGDGNDIIKARTGDQSIFGEDGNDFLRGGEGNDTLHGGFGVDYLRGGEGADAMNGFAGQDWADYITSSSAVTVDLAAGVGTGGDAQGDTYLFIERVYGSNFDDTITGDSRVNYLRGAGGDDTINGGGGVDYLQGDAGADTLDGGAGGDYAYYVSSSFGLTIDLGDPSNNTGEAVGDSYTSIENIVGTRFDDMIYGDAANNFLRGLEGNDQIFGEDGADFLRGDQGADVLDGGNGLDWAYYATSNAAVTVDLGAGTASGGHATGDSFISIERVFGSVYGDSITGDGGNNYLRGFSGNDTLMGGVGIDFLQGDAGADVLDGGAGTDWAYYLSSNTGLTIDLANSSNNTGEAAGDTYISIESVIGSSFADTITGDAGNNYLRGFSGDDVIDGGAGNDTLRGDAGADTFVFASGGGDDVIIDWSDADDFLDLTGFGFTDVNDALSNAVDDANGDVVFTIGGDTITVENTTVNDIMDNLII